MDGWITPLGISGINIAITVIYIHCHSFVLKKEEFSPTLNRSHLKISTLSLYNILTDLLYNVLQVVCKL